LKFTLLCVSPCVSTISVFTKLEIGTERHFKEIEEEEMSSCVVMYNMKAALH